MKRSKLGISTQAAESPAFEATAGAGVVPERMLDAKAAAARLGVSRATLYAYVSRGLVRTGALPDEPRRHLYASADIEALIQRKAHWRRPASAAASALDWGLPVLETRITRLEPEGLFYRGREVAALAEAAGFEQAAALLWNLKTDDPFAAARFDADQVTGWSGAGAMLDGAGPIERALALVALLVPRFPPPAPGHPPPAPRIAHLTLALAEAVAGSPLAAGLPLHRALARAWRKPAAADAIRRALVLVADHELNASTFAVRVAASTGANLPACLLAGLAALSGPQHGGMTARVAAFFTEAARAPSAAAAVAARLGRGEGLPGFRHPLYPDGDPRAAALLPRLPLPPSIADTIAAVEAIGDYRPTIDVALVALARAFRLPEGAPLALFALGRSAGWIAHAIEQQASGQLIRPRARFVGETQDP